jgi:hypothetical protein
MSDLPRSSRVEIHSSTALFLALLAAHVVLVFSGWRDESLRGNEFRQVQTAMAAMYAQKEGCQINYPMPLLGSPWCAPMEFPMYQWLVAKVSTWTHWPLIQSGRAVSLACFYAFLPAVWILLRRAGLTPWQRRLTLGLVLATPTYIFYSRGFTIEPLALFFSLWFAAALIEALTRDSLVWLAIAIVAGIGAGLEKITTWMVYLIPVGVWMLITAFAALRKREPWNGKRWRRLTAVGAALLLPVAIAIAWVRFSDALKADHPSSAFLVSTGMTAHNFGTLAVRLSSQFWADLNHMWTVAAAPPLLWALLCVAAWWAGRWRPFAWGCLALFGAAPMIFPILYSWHDYYFYANTVLLAAGAGFVIAGWSETFSSRWPAWLVLIACLGFQYSTYFREIFPLQRTVTSGGSGLTFALRDLTNEQDVLVIAGQDWNGFIPFYSRRRALMIRRNDEHRLDWIARAFDHLRNDFVAVLILDGAQRENHALLDLAVRRLDIDPRPIANAHGADVYANRVVRSEYISRLRVSKYPEVTILEGGTAPDGPLEGGLRPGQGDAFFSAMSPQPHHYRVPYGLSCYDVDKSRVFFAHADSSLWFKVPAGRRKVHVEFGLLEGSYTGDHSPTDGVTLAVSEQRADGTDRLVTQSFIDPARQEKDRHLQTLDTEVELARGSEIRVSLTSGPAGNASFDWGYIKTVRIE